ncbi:MAG: MarR family transcriptional regulator [bacterium]
MPDEAFRAIILDEPVMRGVAGIVRYRDEFNEARYLEYLDKVPHSTYRDIEDEFNITKARVSQMIAISY